MGLKLMVDGSEWTSLLHKELTLQHLASIWANPRLIGVMVEAVEGEVEDVGAEMTTGATDALPLHTTVVVVPVTPGQDHTPPVSTTERPFKMLTLKESLF